MPPFVERLSSGDAGITWTGGRVWCVDLCGGWVEKRKVFV